MSQEEIDSLAGELKKLSEQLAPRVDLAKPDIDKLKGDALRADEDYKLQGCRDGGTIVFLSPDLQSTASLATLIAGQFPGELSQQFLEGKIRQALCELKGKQGKELWMCSKKCIAELIADVRKLPAQHEVIFPILNLALPAGSLDFGALTLHPRAEGDAIEELARDMDDPLLNGAHLTAMQAYGSASVNARDSSRIQSNALEMAEDAFNVIRLFRSYKGYRHFGIITVAVAKEAIQHVMWHRPIIDDTPAQTEQAPWSMTHDWRRAIPFPIKPDFLAYMRIQGFDEIGSLCFSTPLNDVHRRIRDSVRWAGQAKITQDNQARFLGQWIALEVLLNPYERNPVGRDVSDAAAFLLSKEPTVESRTRAAEHFRGFWTTRNAIVHQGEAVSENDCETLGSNVTWAVTALTRKHETGITNLRNWFESQKYSTAEDASSFLGRP